jgi:putative YhdH/YhfP family quinone oxidoreductase
MHAPFHALVVRQQDGQAHAALETLTADRLSAGEVTLCTRYAGMNYKDCLSLLGKARIISSYPRIPGIEAVGEVVASDDAAFSPGDAVLVHGFQTGIDFDGGLSEVMRVPARHLQHVPEGLTPRQAAIIGVPGFTAAMALERFETWGLRPGDGPIAVTGAGGAVGRLAIHILSRAGYRVAALTRDLAQADALHALGASDVLDAGLALAPPRPLEKARFAAAIDNVGGGTLAWLLRSMQDGGLVASVGNAAGNTFDGSVLPFIMRRVHLFGMVANATWEERLRLWHKLAQDWAPDFAALAPDVHEIALADVLTHAQRQLAGATSGRTLVAFGEAA